VTRHSFWAAWRDPRRARGGCSVLVRGGHRPPDVVVGLLSARSTARAAAGGGGPGGSGPRGWTAVAGRRAPAGVSERVWGTAGQARRSGPHLHPSSRWRACWTARLPGRGFRRSGRCQFTCGRQDEPTPATRWLQPGRSLTAVLASCAVCRGCARLKCTASTLRRRAGLDSIPVFGRAVGMAGQHDYVRTSAGLNAAEPCHAAPGRWGGGVRDARRHRFHEGCPRLPSSVTCK